MSWRNRITSALMHAMQDIRPARESLRDTVNANFRYGMVGKDAMAPISRLTGGISTAADDAARVEALAAKMSSPQGYIERLLADDAGNIIEGQHRFDALRQLGARDIPVTRLIDLARPYDHAGVESAISSVMKGHPDQVRQMARHAFESAHQYGSPMAALAETSMPAQYQAAYEAALKAMVPR